MGIYAVLLVLLLREAGRTYDQRRLLLLPKPELPRPMVALKQLNVRKLWRQNSPRRDWRMAMTRVQDMSDRLMKNTITKTLHEKPPRRIRMRTQYSHKV